MKNSSVTVVDPPAVLRNTSTPFEDGTRQTRDSIEDISGPRTPHYGDWRERIDERTLEAPDRWVQSACVLCSNGCALDIGVKGGKIVGVRGRGVDWVNRGRLGPKGLHSREANASPHRLKRPLIRRNGKLKEASWDEAILPTLLEESAKRHSHLCPRQVLGVRMGLYAGRLLKMELPRVDKRMLVIIQTDGCAVDGIRAATRCDVGGRTMQIYDYGKVAATFVDYQTGRAIRIAPRANARCEAGLYAPEARDRREAMLLGYQRMADKFLFTARGVELNTPLQQLAGCPGARTRCNACGEEIANQREVYRRGQPYCRACAEGAYYRVTKECPRGAVRDE